VESTQQKEARKEEKTCNRKGALCIFTKEHYTFWKKHCD